jgi:protein kinase X
VDWWALGILIYEMLSGFAPFTHESTFTIYRNILEGDLRFPRHFDAKAASLVSKLLTLDPSRRLGCLRDGAEDVKRHRWFASLDWEALLHLSVAPPYVPEIRSDGDTVHFPEEYPDSDDEPGSVTAADQALFRAFDEF